MAAKKLHVRITGNVTIKPERGQEESNDFHWVPKSQALLRKFQAECVMRFGGKKASKVMDALVKQWLDGKVKVRL